MTQLRVIVTAGFDRAKHAVALCELLRRQGVKVVGILVVSPYNIRRFRSVLRQRGLGFIRQAGKRLLGLDGNRTRKRLDEMDKLLTEKDIRFKSLKRWANTFGVSYKSVPSLNHPKALSFIGDLHPDGVLYGGGGILKKAFLDAAQHKVLNPHSGPLPHVRGMNACEWSLLLGFQPTVTIHFIDVGIDTGAVVDALPVAVDPGDDIALLRSKCTVIGIEGLIKNLHYLNLPLVQNRSDACLLTRQCYVLSPVLSELLERRLEQGVYVNRGSTR